LNSRLNFLLSIPITLQFDLKHLNSVSIKPAAAQLVAAAMREVLAYHAERESEFSRHLFVARSLQTRVDESMSDGNSQIEIRHINTLKSGLLVHLYNIVEAVTTRTMKVVGTMVVTDKPKLWTEAMLKEWVRAAIWSGEERIGEGALSRLTQVSGVLASGEALDPFVVKGEPGSWDDDAIKKVAKRLGCSLVLPSDIQRRAYETVYRDETTAMKYLARRRNDIAHGNTTFEEGAHDLTLDEISELADRVIPFLKSVTESYDTFLRDKIYLTSQEAAA
jgi:MAE_28990/MAE_18760-like HEPN